MLVLSRRFDATLVSFFIPTKIISTRPKGNRKSGSRRSPRAQVLGSAGPGPAARARYAAATPAPNNNKSPASRPAPTQTADKIIVSNLPYDVNEAQIKVCRNCFYTLYSC